MPTGRLMCVSKFEGQTEEYIWACCRCLKREKGKKKHTWAQMKQNTIEDNPLITRHAMIVGLFGMCQLELCSTKRQSASCGARIKWLDG